MTSHNTTLPIYDSIQFAVLITFPDDGHSAGRLGQGCPNAAVPLKAHTAAFPLKSVGGRSWSCISSTLSSRPELPSSGFQEIVDRSGFSRLRGVPVSLLRGICACIMVDSVFKVLT